MFAVVIKAQMAEEDYGESSTLKNKHLFYLTLDNA